MPYDHIAGIMRYMAEEALLQHPTDQALQSFSAPPAAAQVTVLKELLSQRDALLKMPSVDHHLVVDRPLDVDGRPVRRSAFVAAQTIREFWAFGRPADYAEDDTRQHGPIHWHSDDMDFFRWSEDEPFRYQPDHERHIEAINATYSSMSLEGAISSLLLLYRLCAALGQWNASTADVHDWRDGPTWKLILLYKPSVQDAAKPSVPFGKLCFEDISGECFVSFDGTLEASDKAAELVNFLLSDECVHRSEKGTTA
jgi:hypothetical protein